MKTKFASTPIRALSLAHITKEQWVDAVIATWKRYGSRVAALKLAYGLRPDFDINLETVIEMAHVVEDYYPKMERRGGYLTIKGEVTSLVALNSSRANNALWAGKFDLARNILLAMTKPKGMKGKMNMPEDTGTGHRGDLIRYVPMCGGRFNDSTDWHKVK